MVTRGYLRMSSAMRIRHLRPCYPLSNYINCLNGEGSSKQEDASSWLLVWWGSWRHESTGLHNFFGNARIQLAMHGCRASKLQGWLYPCCQSHHNVPWKTRGYWTNKYCREALEKKSLQEKDGAGCYCVHSFLCTNYYASHHHSLSVVWCCWFKFVSGLSHKF